MGVDSTPTAKRMKLGLIVRHAVLDQGTLEEFVGSPSNPGIARRVADMAEQAPAFDHLDGAKVVVALRLTVARDRLTSQQRDAAEEARRSLGDVLTFYEPRDFGPKTGIHWFLNNSTLQAWGADVIINMDGDQFVLEPRQTLTAAVDVARKTVAGEHLYFQGARSVPVVLGKTPRGNRLRQIHELVHSIAMGSERLRAQTPQDGVTPAYAGLGESTSGYNALNFGHPRFQELRRIVNSTFDGYRTGRVAGPFSLDYLMALAAASVARVGSTYVPARENRIYGELTEEKEVAGAERLITLSSADLARTVASRMLARAVVTDHEGTRSRLAPFYLRDEIDTVLGWMKAGLDLGRATT